MYCPRSATARRSAQCLGWALGLLLALAAAPAAALSLQCAGPDTVLEVEVDATADRCAIDGARASLRKPHDPVVCHLATPQLRILTIGTDGGFIWEDTGAGRVVRGTCERI